MATTYPTQPQLLNPNSHIQFDSAPFATNNHQLDNSHQIPSLGYTNSRSGLALALPESSSSPPSSQMIDSPVVQSNSNSFDDWSQNRDKGDKDFLSEEEIRIRSNEMLENDDMQHLLRLFSMGNANVTDGFTFPSYIPSPSPQYSYDEDHTRPGKAVVGWLKIKAAMRWGFFVRKKAAERRALQIVELDDE